MKKLLFGTLIAMVTVSASAFKHLNKSISGNYLVQRTAGQYTIDDEGFGACVSISVSSCKYRVTSLGKANIPTKVFYTMTDITTYISNGWLYPGDANKIYID